MLIPAVFLGLGERQIGMVNQFLRRARLFPLPEDAAHAEGDVGVRERHDVMPQILLLNVPQNAFRHLINAFRVGLRQHDDEFLAAQAADQPFVLRHGVLQAAGDARQHLVPGHMPIGVVEGFEGVDIRHDHAQVSAAARDDLFQIFFQTPAVGQPCQVVHGAQFREAMVLGLPLGVNLVENKGETPHFPGTRGRQKGGGAFFDFPQAGQVAVERPQRQDIEAEQQSGQQRQYHGIGHLRREKRVFGGRRCSRQFRVFPVLEFLPEFPQGVANDLLVLHIDRAEDETHGEHGFFVRRQLLFLAVPADGGHAGRHILFFHADAFRRQAHGPGFPGHQIVGCLFGVVDQRAFLSGQMQRRKLLEDFVPALQRGDFVPVIAQMRRVFVGLLRSTSIWFCTRS